MMKCSRVVSNIGELGIIGVVRTLWFNFRYLPFKQAVKLPFILTSKVHIKHCKRGNIVFTDKVRPFMVFLGADLTNHFNMPSHYNISGKLIVHGSQSHVIGVGAVLIIGSNGILELGDNLSVASESKIVCLKSITIGKNNLWSHTITVRDSDGHSIVSAQGEVLNHDKEVIIGDHVWMGFGVKVLKGAVIPDNSIIGANSLINRKLPPPVAAHISVATTDITLSNVPQSECVTDVSSHTDNAHKGSLGGVYVGVPAKLIKTDVRWSYTSPSYYKS